MKHDILTIIRILRLKPTQLMEAMRERSFPDIQRVLQELIYEGEIIFSSEQYLEIPIPYKP
jgi:hypothetical protein